METYQGRVEIDAVDASDIFPATLVRGQHWNGFACPSFDLETARKVVEWVEGNQGDDDYHRFTWTTDREGGHALLLTNVDGDDQYHEYMGDDDAGYGVGAFSWTWQEVADDMPHDEASINAYLADRRTRTEAYCSLWNATLHAAYAAGASAAEAYKAAARATGTYADAS